jgi:AraC-like DNA-binding protein
LQQAANLLATTEDPVKEIALNLGFNSVSHFSNAFRLKRNITPTAFRQSASGIYQPPAPSLASIALSSDDALTLDCPGCPLRA